MHMGIALAADIISIVAALTQILEAWVHVRADSKFSLLILISLVDVVI